MVQNGNGASGTSGAAAAGSRARVAPAKAVVLLSGGLDSRIAAKMMLDQGVELLAMNFVSPLSPCSSRGGRSEARAAARALGIPLKVENATAALLEAVRHPQFGYGRGLNPCIDCRIAQLRRAGDYMRDNGATFIVTGEVLGQRPMSQHRQALETIDRESGLAGRILRPLSAKFLPLTDVERDGLVDRTRLGAVTGRSRKEQMLLARELGITDYPMPAGGCLLTDPGFAGRLRTLLDEFVEISAPQLTLLRAGRHLFSSVGERIIVPRDDLENRRLFNLRRSLTALAVAEGPVGPLAGILVPEQEEKRGPAERTIQEAAALVARYGKGRNQETVSVRVYSPDGSWERVLQASPREGAHLAEELRRV